MTLCHRFSGARATPLNGGLQIAFCFSLFRLFDISEFPVAKIAGFPLTDPMTAFQRSVAFEDYRLDADMAELWKGERQIPLEPQVFDLMWYLVNNGDHIVSRDELIEHVWGGRIVSDAAISTRLNAVRTALDDDGKTQRLIRTIPRRGFRFVGQLIADEGKEGAADEAPGIQIAPPGPGAGIRYLRSFDGVHIAYEALGNGPPLMKAPNFLSHLELERTSPLWGHWVRELSRMRTLVRMDQRGNGLSDWDVENISFEAFVKDLLHVMDAMSIERAPILGLSQGGAIAARFAYEHPDRVSGLIIVGGYVAGWRRLGDQDQRKRREAMLELMGVGWGENNPAFRQVYSGLFIPGGTTEQLDWLNEMQRASTTPENAYRILNSFGDIDVRPELPDIDVPALIVHCRQDAMVPFEAGRQFALNLPDARLVTLEGQNHVLLEEDPGWPIFLSEVTAFLNRIG